MSTPETVLRRCLSEQLNAHSEQLNATMRHHGTELVAFTLGSHLKSHLFSLFDVAFSAIIPPSVSRRIDVERRKEGTL